MFTGLVETTGTIARMHETQGGRTLRIRCRLAGRGLAVGESISIDGACLTIVARGRGWFETFAAPETVRRTVVGFYEAGRRVNLERALAADARLGGHFVQGHIDGRARLRSIRPEGESLIYRFDLTRPARPLGPLIVEKGSIALDGVSLTVSGVGKGWFEVMLIPHTLDVTNLKDRVVGDELNVEADVIGKYVQNLLAPAWLGRGGSAREA